MVTWLKKLSYSTGTKIIASVLLCVSAFFMFNSLAGIAKMPNYTNWYESYHVKSQLTYKAGFVRDWIVRYSDESIFDPTFITDEEIESYRKLDGSAESDEEIQNIIIRDRREYYEAIQRELVQDNVNVEFLAIHLKTQQVITNIEAYNGNNAKELIEMLKYREGTLRGNGTQVLMSNTATYEEVRGVLTDKAVNGYFSDDYYRGPSFQGAKDFEIYVALAEELKPGDWFYGSKTSFDNSMALKDRVYLWGIMGIVLALILLGYWFYTTGQKEKKGVIHLKWIDHVPFEFQCILYGGGMLLWAFILVRSFDRIVPHNWMPYAFSLSTIRIEVVIFFLLSIGVLYSLLFAGSLFRHIKNRSLSHYIGTIRIIKWAFINLFKEKTLPVGVVLSVGAYFLIHFVFTVIFMSLANYWIIYFFGFIGMAGFAFLSIGAVLKVALDYQKLFRGSKEIAAGNLKSKIQLKYALPIMNDMAHTINHIGEGLEQAVENSLKSERLKTELITNVSHDLKTPLTSIISYIDLLKLEKIENTAAKEYIQVLDERSSRLKQLVEDLVEASKAVTGNIKAHLAPVELHELLRQIVGEYTDRLEANGLTVIMNKTEEVSILADGRHMYRVLDNLLSNVNKYAMPQTRVYIEVTREGGYGLCTIKNISKEYLDIDPRELTKRFVRGDQSRSSEGSGLGLAITESLVKLQKGIFSNSIDGDLFKVEIKIPIS